MQGRCLTAYPAEGKGALVRSCATQKTANSPT